MMSSCTRYTPTWTALLLLIGILLDTSSVWAAGGGVTNVQAAAPKPAASQPAPAAAAAPEEADAPADEASVKLRLVPQSVSYSRNASFNEHGDISHQNSYLNLSMQVHYTSRFQLSGYELLSVEPMETTHGHQLTPNVHTRRSNINQHHQEQSQFHLSINVQNPGNATGKIRSIQGKLFS